jgi:hypothetical protein
MVPPYPCGMYGDVCKPEQCKLKTRPGGTPGPAVPCMLKQNAERGVCTPCPKHPFPIELLSVLGGPGAQTVRDCCLGRRGVVGVSGMGKEPRDLAVIPGTLARRASSEPAPWRDLGGLERHVILPQPGGGGGGGRRRKEATVTQRDNLCSATLRPGYLLATQSSPHDQTFALVCNRVCSSTRCAVCAAP